MSLKSGLLAESTWAIDALNILLYDDNTIAYFHLKHFPGLVGCLMEHFLKCLKLIFNEQNGDEFADLVANQFPYPDDTDDDTDSPDEHEHQDIKPQIMKINFSERDARKRFMHYYKSSKFNDSKVCPQWLAYNQKILDHSARKSDREKRSNTDRELNNHLLTNFTGGDELTSRLYTTCHATETRSTFVRPGGKRKLNEDFIKQHMDEEVADAVDRAGFEDQPVSDEEALFKIINERNTELMNRCVALSTIFRNLSFVPGNEIELCKYKLFLKVLARLLILKHRHKIVLSGGDEHTLDEELGCIKELMRKNLFYTENMPEPAVNNEWWCESVQLLRENTLVTIANLAAALNLNSLDEDVIELYAHGLIHWSICKSNDAQDTCQDSAWLSPQRLAIEALSKMTINEINVDLILATMSRTKPCMDSLISILCSEWLVKREDETNREFSVVLVTAIAKCDQFAARSIARHASFLIAFIEDFEEQARRHSLIHLPSSSGGVVYDSNINEEHLGTTVDMLRRCANCLMYLANYDENIPFIVKHEHRLLELITSQFVDFKVSQTLAEVLFYCSLPHKTTPAAPPQFTYAFLNPTVNPSFI